MHKLALAVIVVMVAGCASSGGGPSGAQTGAGSAEAAVNAYMAAMKARDIQAMSAVWGTSRGSVRETMSREQVEKSGTIVMGLMCPDEFRVLSNVQGDEGRRELRGQMKRGQRTIDLTFVVVQASDRRWYVEDVPLNGDLPQRLQAFCR